MRKVLVLQHNRYETLGIISQALAHTGVIMAFTHLYQGQRLPKTIEDIAGIISLGGPMGVYEQDKYPFLQEELALLERALIEAKPILGICLGSQLLATALGGAVTKGEKEEIGWYPVTLTAEGTSDPLWAGVEHPFMAFHWHGDVSALPRGAVCLASSDLTENQAFRYHDNAYGVLFHMEVTDRIIQEMVNAFSDELHQAGVSASNISVQASQHLPSLHKVGEKVFRAWAEIVKRPKA